MKLIVVISFLLISSTVFSQTFIGKTKGEVKEYWIKYLSKNWMKVEFNEYDSLVTFDIRDSGFKKVDYIYVFDKDQKCNTEIIMACDNCILKYFKDNLKSKKYKWKFVNDSVYYSSQSNGLKMERFRQDSMNILRIAKIN